MVLPWSAPIAPVILGSRMSCSAIGIPPVNIVIMRNSKIVANATNAASILVNKAGTYICRATSKYGTDEKQLVLTNGEDTQGRLFHFKCLFV